MSRMNYLQKNDIFREDSSSDNSVDSINTETSEEIEEPAEETSEEPAEETSEEPAEETSEELAEEPSVEPAELTSEEPAEETSDVPAEETSEDSTVFYSVSFDSLSYNGITPPMFYESFSICIFLLAAILGCALFNIFRSKL